MCHTNAFSCLHHGCRHPWTSMQTAVAAAAVPVAAAAARRRTHPPAPQLQWLLPRGRPTLSLQTHGTACRASTHVSDQCRAQPPMCAQFGSLCVLHNCAAKHTSLHKIGNLLTLVLRDALLPACCLLPRWLPQPRQQHRRQLTTCSCCCPHRQGWCRSTWRILSAAAAW
jgi:hypothetical protein